MASAFKLPDLGEGLTEGEVARWLVSEGQEIGEDDPLVEIQTDKATVEIPSPYAGTVLRILVADGAVVPVGTELVLIGEAGEEPSNNLLQAPGASPASGEQPQVTSCYKARAARPAGERRRRRLCRRIAQELGVDLASIAGTGPGGRITEDDVRAARPVRPRAGASRCAASGA